MPGNRGNNSPDQTLFPTETRTSWGRQFVPVSPTSAHPRGRAGVCPAETVDTHQWGFWNVEKVHKAVRRSFHTRRLRDQGGQIEGQNTAFAYLVLGPTWSMQLIKRGCVSCDVETLITGSELTYVNIPCLQKVLQVYVTQTKRFLRDIAQLLGVVGTTHHHTPFIDIFCNSITALCTASSITSSMYPMYSPIQCHSGREHWKYASNSAWWLQRCTCSLTGNVRMRYGRGLGLRISRTFEGVRSIC